MRGKSILIGIAALFVAMILFSSCEDSRSVKLKAESKLENLGQYISPSEDEIAIKLVNDIEDGNEVKKITPSLTFIVNKPVSCAWGFRLYLDILDKDRNKIAELKYYVDAEYDKESARYYLKSGNNIGLKTTEQKYWVNPNWWYGCNQKKWDKIKQEGVYAVIREGWDNAPYRDIE